jgi:hypothetical protein
MKLRDEGGAIDLAAAGCPVTEPDDVRTCLPKPKAKGDLLGVKRERNEAHVAVDVIPDEDGEFAARQ